MKRRDVDGSFWVRVPTPEFRLSRAHELFPAFVRHMIREWEWELEHVVYCMEKPWKWTEEFSAWVAEEGLER